MKYHTLGSSNISAETKTSGFTLYADMGISENKISYTETDMKKIREELENVQKDLKRQTRRCRYLVAEYTRKLQEKEQLYKSEKALRDTQLAKVLKALLIFEARLKQEQKLISHQLNEKDFIIITQKNDIKKLLEGQYCKNCSQYYTSPAPTFESLDSSSEYVVTEHDYQSSNMESLDSSSETYGVSERDYSRSESDNYEDLNIKNNLQKNKYASQTRRKVGHKKSTGTYFEVLKLRNDSPLSNDDNTSADYDNLDSLPPESISDKISMVSENIENMLNKTKRLGSTASESSVNISSSECDKTVITTIATKFDENFSANAAIHQDLDTVPEKESQIVKESENKLTETIPVFECSADTNDNWYASASDQEDEDHRDIYRNNPVLECMNQILLQNINDINSPPKTPNIERKNNKNNKRVTFSDEEDKHITKESISKDESHDYYETPIQKTPNFYETPQSIYSNDYEQILSKCSETSSESSRPKKPQDSNKESQHYIEMEKLQDKETNPIRKNKILRVPPALPPKPPNLASKCKIHILPKKPPSEHETSSIDLEPDYCSISELNLPQNKVSVKKISVVAEIHTLTSNDIKNRMNIPALPSESSSKKSEQTQVAPQLKEDQNLVVKKCVENLNIQLAKNTTVVQSPKKKNDVQIPKLPQVSEIIIPDDPDENEEEMISQDNYVKNNTQILQGKTIHDSRKPIIIGSSVSSLISGFNNHQILNKIKKKHDRTKADSKKMFSSFDNLQNLDKHFAKNSDKTADNLSFENFDLSQNFEEFKLDDCEIEEYDVEEELEREEKAKGKDANKAKIVDVREKPPSQTDKKVHSTRVDYIRATNKTLPTLNQTSVEVLKKQLELQRNQNPPNKHSTNNDTKRMSNQPTYEHFLECTGLSSKSILIPSRTTTNHKHMLKPKDVKLRSKVKANASIFEKFGGSKMKYWSEPFI